LRSRPVDLRAAFKRFPKGGEAITSAGYKIGCDAGTLLWLGEKHVCRIDSPRLPGADYPDQGSSAEVWTNPDPLPYIELEMLGPLYTLKPGDTIAQTNRYTLLRRTLPDAQAEAAALLAR
jgi:hypothetical protein